MVARLEAAIAKLENRHEGVPIGERVADNIDYARLVQLIDRLKKFLAACLTTEQLLTQLGV